MSLKKLLFPKSKEMPSGKPTKNPDYIEPFFPPIERQMREQFERQMREQAALAAQQRAMAQAQMASQSVFFPPEETLILRDTYFENPGGTAMIVPGPYGKNYTLSIAAIVTTYNEIGAIPIEAVRKIKEILTPKCFEIRVNEKMAEGAWAIEPDDQTFTMLLILGSSPLTKVQKPRPRKKRLDIPPSEKSMINLGRMTRLIAQMKEEEESGDADCPEHGDAPVGSA